MALPISVKAKGVLWVILFGLAKCFQYGGITILGVEGFKRVKSYFKRNKRNLNDKNENKDKNEFPNRQC